MRMRMRISCRRRDTASDRPTKRPPVLTKEEIEYLAGTSVDGKFIYTYVYILSTENYIGISGTDSTLHTDKFCIESVYIEYISHRIRYLLILSFLSLFPVEIGYPYYNCYRLKNG